MKTDVYPVNIEKYNGMVTIYNPETGGHRTFKVNSVTNKESGLYGKRIISLLTGSDNESDYTGFGFVDSNGKVRVWSKKLTKAFIKYADMFNHMEKYVDRVDYSMAIRCRICNRTLTEPTSIETGIGPICAGR